MGISVKELKAQFTSLKPRDIENILGTSNYQETTIIPLNKFANCKSDSIKSYVAKREGTPFLQLLNPTKRAEISQGANIPTQKTNNNLLGQSLFAERFVAQHIPMDQSIFTLQNKSNLG